MIDTRLVDKVSCKLFVEPEKLRWFNNAMRITFAGRDMAAKTPTDATAQEC